MEGTVEDDLREETQIYVCDINPNMLNVGNKRAQERGLRDLGSLVWVEGDAEKLTFKDDLMDGYTIAFGIRNVTHIEKVLAEAYRYFCTLINIMWYSKKGGRFLCLELSHVDTPVFKQLQVLTHMYVTGSHEFNGKGYDYYSFSVIPVLGELVAGDRDCYQYLVESVRRFPPQEVFASMIVEC
ncbi:putative 2-methoxy-6-polyprenyl-1,4-benzoquinol methylase [Helianthus annuus]|nr:putative 2-methoxy-6-polyprenyl-1,4-benzoquinol methylase [Helianthus annuus]KAJ0517036.1 putative 2-methoxy-6-polyprenyl-1,4-benzoquinol methylase [Helianthus annuus]KAJ0685045.1 putative 2-methoxy-6-polyprenyl-1,4-benzoquinol methylase [Helianthus annuus]KAJ0688968.1 putative 2-methoxy-6-polyprenyl-1,4-benzoquinol methylase [Helianthus annuus]KAJ0870211.1 putative 2-methoxy-6-polyprenyl-1,4-benzoquinol methylase [Helianthus annuus]